jgi:hypothetical protein
MISIIISTLVLCAAMYLIARHEAEISLPVILMICVGVNVIGGLLGLMIGPFALLVTIALLAWSLQKFCYLGWSKAFTVTGIYLVTNVLLAFGLRALKS